MTHTWASTPASNIVPPGAISCRSAEQKPSSPRQPNETLSMGSTAASSAISGTVSPNPFRYCVVRIVLRFITFAKRSNFPVLASTDSRDAIAGSSLSCKSMTTRAVDSGRRREPGFGITRLYRRVSGRRSKNDNWRPACPGVNSQQEAGERQGMKSEAGRQGWLTGVVPACWKP